MTAAHPPCKSTQKFLFVSFVSSFRSPHFVKDRPSQFRTAGKNIKKKQTVSGAGDASSTVTMSLPDGGVDVLSRLSWMFTQQRRSIYPRCEDHPHPGAAMAKDTRSEKAE